MRVCLLQGGVESTEQQLQTAAASKALREVSKMYREWHCDFNNVEIIESLERILIESPPSSCVHDCVVKPKEFMISASGSAPDWEVNMLFQWTFLKRSFICGGFAFEHLTESNDKAFSNHNFLRNQSRSFLDEKLTEQLLTIYFTSAVE